MTVSFHRIPLGGVRAFLFLVSARHFSPQDMVAFLGVFIIADTRIY